MRLLLLCVVAGLFCSGCASKVMFSNDYLGPDKLVSRVYQQSLTDAGLYQSYLRVCDVDADKLASKNCQMTRLGDQ